MPPHTNEAEAVIKTPVVPDYLLDTYYWAYINPVNVAKLDKGIVVWLILWGNATRLMNAAFQDIKPGDRVLQAAHVYGDFALQLAQHVGPKGSLDVIDVVPLQVERCQWRLKDTPWATAHLADAAEQGCDHYDAVCCYFLLHELPLTKRIDVINNLLNRVQPDGKVIFVDYHKPMRFHPLRPVMEWIWKRFEPFAMAFMETDIEALASSSEKFHWKKTTRFGGLYQKVVATRL